jgi:hypothetical protein
MSRIQIPLRPDRDILDPEAAGPGNRRQWPRYALPERESFTITADGRSGRLGHAYARRCWKAKDHLGVAFDHSGPSLAFIAGCVAEGTELGAATPAD